MKTIIDYAREIPARFYDIPISCLNLKTRKREIVQCRQISHWLLKEYTKMSLYEIGYEIGRKDHATVLYSRKTINNLMETDNRFREHMKIIISRFEKERNRDQEKKEHRLAVAGIIEKIRVLTNKKFLEKCIEREFESESLTEQMMNMVNNNYTNLFCQ